METLAYILNKYNLTIPRRSPIEIPDTGRVQLAELFGELGYEVGAEIGTERGAYAEVLCKANPSVRLYCVDPYEVYPGYRDYNGKEQRLHQSFAEAEQRLAPYNVTFLRRYSMDACHGFDDRSLDFVYIDANHEWPYITQDIYYWAKKVRRGGIVAGHDYYRSTRIDSKCHVKHAVQGYMAAFLIHPWFILGLDAKIPGMIRDNSRSWFWVKG